MTRSSPTRDVDLVRARAHDGCERERRLLRQHPSRRILASAARADNHVVIAPRGCPGEAGPSAAGGVAANGEGSDWNLDHDVLLVVGPASYRCRRLLLRHRASEQMSAQGEHGRKAIPGR